MPEFPSVADLWRYKQVHEDKHTRSFTCAQSGTNALIYNLLNFLHAAPPPPQNPPMGSGVPPPCSILFVWIILAVMNGAITLISTINLCFKDTSIFCNADGGGAGGVAAVMGCVPDLRVEGRVWCNGVGGGQGCWWREEGESSGPLSDVCQFTSGCKNKWDLWRQMKMKGSVFPVPHLPDTQNAPKTEGEEGEKQRGRKRFKRYRTSTNVIICWALLLLLLLNTREFSQSDLSCPEVPEYSLEL